MNSAFYLRLMNTFAYDFMSVSRGSPISVFMKISSKIGEIISKMPNFSQVRAKRCADLHSPLVASPIKLITQQKIIKTTERMYNFLHKSADILFFPLKLSTTKQISPSSDMTPCMKPITAIIALPQYQPCSHRKVHTTLEPKCANFKAKYKLTAIMKTALATKTINIEILTPKKVCLTSQSLPFILWMRPMMVTPTIAAKCRANMTQYSLRSKPEVQRKQKTKNRYISAPRMKISLNTRTD